MFKCSELVWWKMRCISDLLQIIRIKGSSKAKDLWCGTQGYIPAVCLSILSLPHILSNVCGTMTIGNYRIKLRTYFCIVSYTPTLSKINVAMRYAKYHKTEIFVHVKFHLAVFWGVLDHNFSLYCFRAVDI